MPGSKARWRRRGSAILWPLEPAATPRASPPFYRDRQVVCVQRICICDYAGHPFQVELSRELARRGHSVLHLHFAEAETPKGRLQVEAGDPGTLLIEAVSLGRPFAKHNLPKRILQEIEIGRRIARRIAAFAPDVVVGANLPLDALRSILATCRKASCPFVFWQQDVYSEAVAKILGQKFGLPGRAVGRYYRHVERRAAKQSAAVVTIASDFVATLERDFGVDAAKIHVIENWAPLGEITPGPTENIWSAAHGLDGKDVVLYTGTIGKKHDPAMILAVAQSLRDRPDTVVVVTSEGPSARWLAEQANASGLTSLKVLPFQPYEVYPQALATAKVLISVLERDAGTFSVPSKILSYLCAGRAIVLSAPPENLASRIVQRAGAGVTSLPGDTQGFVTGIRDLLDDAGRRSACSRAARAFAESKFAIEDIATRFERIFYACLGGERPVEGELRAQLGSEVAGR
jgi:colanic acid biosynthesis glycosyl transferase WcaI